MIDELSDLFPPGENRGGGGYDLSCSQRRKGKKKKKTCTYGTRTKVHICTGAVSHYGVQS